MNADKSPDEARPPDPGDPSQSAQTPSEDGEARKKRIQAIREKIDAGEYDTEERMEKSLEAMLKQMFGRDD